jgi:hypothetical protein
VTIFVFLGPTMSVDDARRELDAAYLPPVAQGDVYRAALKRPTAIGIIDGYFDRVPSVWHKEILWAMTQGIHVFGAASLGALRAAELAPYGMEGIGQVFEWYRDGTLDGDDEVALAHASAEYGYRALSEPLVNVRATLQCAVERAVITATTRTALEAIAKDLFYPQRTFAHILDVARVGAVPAAECAALARWLPQGRINVKQDDARLMLRTMRERFARGCAPREVSFELERTALWDDLTREAGDLRIGDDRAGEMAPLDDLLTELQLERDGYARAADSATARLLAIEEARRHHLEIDEDALYHTIVEFRREHQLLEPEELERWMRDNALGQADFVQLMGELAAQQWTATLIRAAVRASLPQHLRLTGDYVRLQERARDKRCTLAARGLLDLEPEGRKVERILHWYFVEQLGFDGVPELRAYAERAGFADDAALRRAIQGEYYYRTAGG